MPKSRDVLELVRIPGIFTAQADIIAGFLIAGATPQRIPAFLSLVVASSCFYSAGMALNDTFDAAIDAKERPARPIPSGRIKRITAFHIGLTLLLIGVLLCRLAGNFSLVIGALIVVVIMTYDGGVKHRLWLGPLNMGACRYLNLLLGLSIAPVGVTSLMLPLLTGIHIFGVTALSRHETAGHDSRGMLVCSVSLVMIPVVYCALWLAGVLPCRIGLVLCSLWAGILLIMVARLTMRPSPGNTQRTVKLLLMGLVILDGIIVTGVCQWLWGWLVWMMILPTVIVAKKFYVT